MKKSFIAPFLGIIGAILLAAIFIYFYISLNRLDKKITEMQNNVVKNSNETAAIVNFFNANLNAQNNK
jgi:hypothetical protein